MREVELSGRLNIARFSGDSLALWKANESSWCKYRSSRLFIVEATDIGLLIPRERVGVFEGTGVKAAFSRAIPMSILRLPAGQRRRNSTQPIEPASLWRSNHPV